MNNVKNTFSTSLLTACKWPSGLPCASCCVCFAGLEKSRKVADSQGHYDKLYIDQWLGSITH